MNNYIRANDLIYHYIYNYMTLSELLAELHKLPVRVSITREGDGVREKLKRDIARIVDNPETAIARLPLIICIRNFMNSGSDYLLIVRF